MQVAGCKRGQGRQVGLGKVINQTGGEGGVQLGWPTGNAGTKTPGINNHHLSHACLFVCHQSCPMEFSCTVCPPHSCFLPFPPKMPCPTEQVSSSVGRTVICLFCLHLGIGNWGNRYRLRELVAGKGASCQHAQPGCPNPGEESTIILLQPCQSPPKCPIK